MTRPHLSLAIAVSLTLAAGCSSSPETSDDGTDAAQATDTGADTSADTSADTGADTGADTSADVAPDSRAASDAEADATGDPIHLRVATFNASLYRQSAGELAADLEGGDDAHARRVAEVIQRVRPDVVLINEFDWDADGLAADRFAQGYLAVGQNGAEPIDYAHRYVPATNTGVHSGVDLDGSGQADDTPGDQSYGNDAFGFGTFPGQYGMVVYSRYPIADDDVRSFQTFLWKDMPDNLMPPGFYSDAAVDVMRLSSKNHVDVPISVGGRTLHVLASHPTPPSFDGSEDRNGRRNHDEIRLWVDYIAGGDQAAYITDDSGQAGGLDADAAFVVVGDLNSDPHDGDSRRGALADLLGHARVQDPQPDSQGAVAAAERDGRANTQHAGDAALDTADFSDGQVGNLRVDYALPSANVDLTDAGVFWPAPDAPHAGLADVSDHHLVWVDLTLSTP